MSMVPYKRKQDGRRIVILYDGVKRSARQYAKVKLEIKIGRRLVNGEEVDHRDRDFTNDKFRNLQVLSTTLHRKKDSRKRRKIKAKCAYCETKFVLSQDQVNNQKRKDKKAGPFCSRTCTGKYGTDVQRSGKTVKRKKYKVKYYY